MTGAPALPTDRIYVAGCPVDVVSRPELVEALARVIDDDARTQVLGVNAAFVVTAHKDPAYLRMLEETPVVVVDGFWVSAASKLLGFKGTPTVGIERLVNDLLARLAEKNSTVYLLGTTSKIVRKAATNIELRYPGIEVVGIQDGFFTPDDEEQILADMNVVRPDVVLVGMSSPKKEHWMARYGSRLDARVAIGVGGLLDVFADEKPAAPIWVKNIGLEWLFRFALDPKRLYKRYTVGNLHFMWLVARDRARRRLRDSGPSRMDRRES